MKQWKCIFSSEGNHSLFRGLFFRFVRKNIDTPHETYLNHILTVLPERFSQNPKAEIDDLLPWTEDIRRKFRVWIFERLYFFA